MTLELSAGEKPVFAPDQPIDGLAGWEFEDAPKWVEVRLFWRTAGKGTSDVMIAATQRYDDPLAVDAQVFSLTAPAGPMSYVGSLIEIVWGVEVVAHKTKENAVLEFILSDTDKPLGT